MRPGYTPGVLQKSAEVIEGKGVDGKTSRKIEVKMRRSVVVEGRARNEGGVYSGASGVPRDEHS
jgi:hypothetical protein